MKIRPVTIIRLLVECYQAFERASAKHLRSLDITPPQFDIIATLGNTQGMTFRELGEKTLITKGTLTGVVDRLAARQLVVREDHAHDGRCSIVKLTPAGEALFHEVFPVHGQYCEQLFQQYNPAQLAQLHAELSTLKQALNHTPSISPRQYRKTS